MLLTVQGVRVTAIISAYNEADIIAQTVADLVRQGIAAYVIDDHSTDGTVDALGPLMTSGLVQVERSADPAGAGVFELARVLSRKEQLARELDSEWFLNHDADEFRESPWRHLDLRQGIELVDRLGYNAIDFAVLNFWPTHDGFDGRADIREEFRYFERGATFDRLQVRCWKKASDIDLQSSAGHDARFESRRVFPVRFLLRHFPIRGQGHGERKVFDERKPRFASGERDRGWHVQYDGLTAGHCFIRDPRDLEVFDPDTVRAQLQIEHRGVEELASRLASVGDLLAGAREEQAVAVRALRDQHAADLGRLTAEVAQANETTRELSAALQAVEGLFHNLENEYRALEKMSRDLERQLADMRQSWSWKLTAPLRTAWRRPTP